MGMSLSTNNKTSITRALRRSHALTELQKIYTPVCDLNISQVNKYMSITLATLLKDSLSNMTSAYITPPWKKTKVMKKAECK